MKKLLLVSILCGIAFVTISAINITKIDTDFEINKNALADYDYPAWCPQGDLIAFHLDKGEGLNIYIMGIDGSNIKQLTFSKGDNAAPFWSPNGDKIGFHSKRNGKWNIYSIDKDGSNELRLTKSKGDDYFPSSWSPDGKSIAFMSNRGGIFDVYSIDVKTLKTINLTNSPALDGVPSWSADGKKILFHSTRHEGHNFQVYQMDADGENVQRITHSKLQSFMGQFNPTNKNQILYLEGNVRHKYDNWEVMLLDTKTGITRNITNNKAYDFKPSWSPKGDQLVFTSRRTGSNHIYIMNLENFEVRKIL